MIVKRKLFSFIDEDGNLGYYLFNERTGEEKLFSVVEEEREFARGKNVRNLGKGNKKLNKKLGRKELIDAGAGKADSLDEAFIALKSGKRLDDGALKEAAKIYDARFNRKPIGEQFSSALSGRTSRSFDELNYNNLKDKDSFYYRSKLEKLRDLKEKKQAAIAELRDSRLAKVKELKAKKLRARNFKIAAGIGAGLTLAGTGAYLTKKHYDKKKSEKKD